MAWMLLVPVAPSYSQASDSDGDGINDGSDNAPTIYNPDQLPGPYLAGRVFDIDNVPLAGVTITLKHHEVHSRLPDDPPLRVDTVATRTTDATGRYTFSQVATTLGVDYYSLTPGKTDLTFTPTSRTTSTDEDVTGLDFSAQAPAFTITIFPASLRGGRTFRYASISLNNPAPQGGAGIAQSSSDAQAVTLPQFIRIAQGSSTANFDVTAKPRQNTTNVQITATYENVSRSTPLTITPGSTWEASDIALSPTGSDLAARMLWNSVPGALSLWRIPTTGSPSVTAPFGPYQYWNASAVAQGNDGKTYVKWNDQNNRLALWRLSTSGELEGNFTYGPYGGWQADDIAVGSDGNTRALWNDIASKIYPQSTDFVPPPRGAMSLWSVSPQGQVISNTTYGPYDGWRAKSLAVGPDNRARVLWTHTDGRLSLWTVAANGIPAISPTYGPYDGWTARDVGVGPDNLMRVLWSKDTGELSLWTVASNGTSVISPAYGPYDGWSARSLAVGSDGKMRVLWGTEGGKMALWTVGTSGSVESNLTYGPY